jgi:hypothetical protein
MIPTFRPAAPVLAPTRPALEHRAVATERLLFKRYVVEFPLFQSAWRKWLLAPLGALNPLCLPSFENAGVSDSACILPSTSNALNSRLGGLCHCRSRESMAFKAQWTPIPMEDNETKD